VKQRRSWNVTTSMPGLHAFVAGDELADLVDGGHDVVVLTADLATSNRMTDFRDRHPERFVNTGIAEQNMMSIGAGMAACGHQAWVSTFASFASLLCAEHLRTDMAYTQLPVRVFAHHAGISMGFYGTSHHAVEDIAIVRAIAGMTMFAPCDAASTRACIRATLDIPGPVYLRAGRGSERDVHGDDLVVRPGEFVELRSGQDVTVIATGVGVGAAVHAADQLRVEDISVRVLDAVSLKPIDAGAIVESARTTRGIVIVEEHNTTGGLGSAVAEVLALNGCVTRISKLGIDDQYALVAPPTHLYRHYGLTPDGVIGRIREVLQ
jgi:transketolase